MSVRYCEPENKVASRADSVQFMVHGVTGTKDYWNGLSYQNDFDGTKYSWINNASKEGYPTFAIDNLGNGELFSPGGLCS
jgi:hypothetical protein